MVSSYLAQEMSRYKEMGWTNSSLELEPDLDVLDEDMQEVVYTRLRHGPIVSQNQQSLEWRGNNGTIVWLVFYWILEIYHLEGLRPVCRLHGPLAALFM